jgi:hypothetical protein
VRAEVLALAIASLRASLETGLDASSTLVEDVVSGRLDSFTAAESLGPTPEQPATR